jgi:hypothetical protein
MVGSNSADALYAVVTEVRSTYGWPLVNGNAMACVYRVSNFVFSIDLKF